MEVATSTEPSITVPPRRVSNRMIRRAVDADGYVMKSDSDKLLPLAPPTPTRPARRSTGTGRSSISSRAKEKEQKTRREKRGSKKSTKATTSKHTKSGDLDDLLLDIPNVIHLGSTTEPPLHPAIEATSPATLKRLSSTVMQQDTKQQSLIIQDLATSRKKMELDNRQLRDQLDLAKHIIQQLRAAKKEEAQRDLEKKQLKCSTDKKAPHSPKSNEGQMVSTTAIQKQRKKIRFWSRKNGTGSLAATAPSKKDAFRNPMVARTSGQKAFAVAPSISKSTAALFAQDTKQGRKPRRESTKTIGSKAPRDVFHVGTSEGRRGSSQHPSSPTEEPKKVEERRHSTQQKQSKTKKDVPTSIRAGSTTDSTGSSLSSGVGFSL